MRCALQFDAGIFARIQHLIAVGAGRSISIHLDFLTAVDGYAEHQMIRRFDAVDLQHISLKADFERCARGIAPVFAHCRVTVIRRSPSAMVGVSLGIRKPLVRIVNDHRLTFCRMHALDGNHRERAADRQQSLQYSLDHLHSPGIL